VALLLTSHYPLSIYSFRKQIRFPRPPMKKKPHRPLCRWKALGLLFHFVITL
jgi:hypothetical protein